MRRKGFEFWLLWVVALLGTSGCGLTDNWSTQQRRYAITGAAVGGLLGAGTGALVGGNKFGNERDDTDDNDERAIGAAAGAAAGALIGGAIGYLLAEGPKPEEPPP
ncbi:MAG: hypothetical protein ACREQ3_08635, partial [Candidatus Binatia bacterium]